MSDKFDIESIAKATLKSSNQLKLSKLPSLEKTLRDGNIDVVDLVNEFKPTGDLMKLRQMHSKNSGTKTVVLPKGKARFLSSERPFTSFTPINIPSKTAGTSPPRAPQPKSPFNIVNAFDIDTPRTVEYWTKRDPIKAERMTWFDADGYNVAKNQPVIKASAALPKIEGTYGP